MNLVVPPSTWLVLPDPNPRRIRHIYDEFLDLNLVGLTAMREVGDLAELPDDPEAFMHAYIAYDAAVSPERARNLARMLYGICYGIKNGDRVVYRATQIDNEFHIGVVVGDYQYRPNLETTHTRPVEWIAHLPARLFSGTARSAYPKMMALSPVRTPLFLNELYHLLVMNGVLEPEP